MLTAFCFLFDGRNNLRSGLSPLAVLYVEKVNISREQKLIKYFKQRNSDDYGWSGPLLLLSSSSLLFTFAHLASSPLAHIYLLFCSFYPRAEAVWTPTDETHPVLCKPMALLYTYFCWPTGNLRLRRRLRRRLMGFSVEDGLRWGLMDFKVWQRISMPRLRRGVTSVSDSLPGDNQGTRLEPTKQTALRARSSTLTHLIVPKKCESGTSSNMEQSLCLAHLSRKRGEILAEGTEPDGAWRCLTLALTG